LGILVIDSGYGNESVNWKMYFHPVAPLIPMLQAQSFICVISIE